MAFYSVIVKGMDSTTSFNLHRKPGILLYYYYYYYYPYFMDEKTEVQRV